MTDINRGSARQRRERVASRVVVLVAAVACLADQPPRWTIESALPVTPAAHPGKALRVTLEASHEPTLQVASIGPLRPWEDLPAARTSWTGRADFFVDAGGVPGRVSIGDRCLSGGGMCSGCDPPPTAFVRVLGITEVDVWTAAATVSVAAGIYPRIDIELDATREPFVVSDPPSSGSCSSAISPSSPASSPGAPPSSPSLAPGGSAQASPSASSSPASPPPGTSRKRVVSCWVKEAATILATIRGACASGPCSPPSGEAISILRTARVP